MAQETMSSGLQSLHDGEEGGQVDWLEELAEVAPSSASDLHTFSQSMVHRAGFLANL